MLFQTLGLAPTILAADMWTLVKPRRRRSKEQPTTCRWTQMSHLRMPVCHRRLEQRISVCHRILLLHLRPTDSQSEHQSLPDQNQKEEPLTNKGKNQTLLVTSR